jgi:hypothetical protein
MGHEFRHGQKHADSEKTATDLKSLLQPVNRILPFGIG